MMLGSLQSAWYYEGHLHFYMIERLAGLFQCNQGLPLGSKST